MLGISSNILAASPTDPTPMLFYPEHEPQRMIENQSMDPLVMPLSCSKKCPRQVFSPNTSTHNTIVEGTLSGSGSELHR